MTHGQSSARWRKVGHPTTTFSRARTRCDRGITLPITETEEHTP